ncbi:alpha/beta-type small acid-soluble spore protein [Halobacillus ihumii]|uniref:alpha/beta-type small acid-soluble spore protein n=1 Tax=Halobacillus ihumii TaxID=2686092 RepID=UPI0013D721EA|nr:alpha/beta-type small acid-soluble spore protein [Halobacillus ihumii]
MARNNKILVPGARKDLDLLKARVMKEKGYNTDPTNVKYEVAKEQGIPLKKGYNGQMTSEQAGKVGGPIGGNMVKEMVKMAQENMTKK